MTRPRVSLVVPCYNYGRYVAHAVNSLLDQTFTALEVIVVDDASVDDTAQVLQQYEHNPRVRVVRHTKNVRHLRSYNEGLALARGEFIGLLSADDFYATAHAVERQVAFFDAHPDVGFVYSSVAFTDQVGKLAWVKRPWSTDQVRNRFAEFAVLLYENHVPHSGTLVRRRCHEELGFYDLRLPHAADWDLWLRLLSRYEAGYIAEPLVGYRIHPGNMHHSTISPREETYNNVSTIRKAFDTLPNQAPSELRRMRKGALRHAWLRSAAVACASGRTVRAWQALADSAYRAPALLLTPTFYCAAAKICAQTLVGHRWYSKLAASKRASRNRDRHSR